MKRPSKKGFGAIALALLLAAGCGATTPAAPSAIEPDAASFAMPGRFTPDMKEYAWRDPRRANRPVTTHTWTPTGLVSPRGLVLISHGSLSTGKLHKFIGEHLSSRGYVVFAVDHYGNSLGDTQLDDVYEHRVRDLQFLIGQAATDPAWDAARIAGVAAVGHSIGGYDALALCGAAIDATETQKACAAGNQLYCRLQDAHSRWAGFPDPRVATCIGLTPFVHPIYGDKGSGAASMDRPVLLIGSTEDSILRLEPYLRQFFEAAPQPATRLLTIKGAGHLSYTDVMNEGSLDHDTIKSITNGYITAWLEWRLHAAGAAMNQFEPGRPESGPFGEHLSLR